MSWKEFETIRKTWFRCQSMYDSRELREFLKKSRNLILAKIVNMCKLAKFAKFKSRKN